MLGARLFSKSRTNLFFMNPSFQSLHISSWKSFSNGSLHMVYVVTIKKFMLIIIESFKQYISLWYKSKDFRCIMEGSMMSFCVKVFFYPKEPIYCGCQCDL
jgi:hypothetical protein